MTNEEINNYFRNMQPFLYGSVLAPKYGHITKWPIPILGNNEQAEWIDIDFDDIILCVVNNVKSFLFVDCLPPKYIGFPVQEIRPIAPSYENLESVDIKSKIVEFINDPNEGRVLALANHVAAATRVSNMKNNLRNIDRVSFNGGNSRITTARTFAVSASIGGGVTFYSNEGFGIRQNNTHLKSPEYNTKPPSPLEEVKGFDIPAKYTTTFYGESYTLDGFVRFDDQAFGYYTDKFEETKKKAKILVPAMYWYLKKEQLNARQSFSLICRKLNDFILDGKIPEVAFLKNGRDPFCKYSSHPLSIRVLYRTYGLDVYNQELFIKFVCIIEELLIQYERIKNQEQQQESEAGHQWSLVTSITDAQKHSDDWMPTERYSNLEVDK